MPLRTSLVAFYKLDDVNDSEDGFNLTNNGTTAFNAGKIGNAADFGASNSTKYLSTTSDLGITGGNFSMSLWFNVTTDPGAGTVYILSNQYDVGTFVGYLIWYTNSAGTRQTKFRRHRQGTANDDVTTNNDAGTGSWQHAVVTYDGTNVEGWYNNVSQGTVASSGNGSSGGADGFTIGSAQVGVGDNKHSGLIDAEGIWSKKLSNAEVNELWNGGNGIEWPFTKAVPASNLLTLQVG